MLFCCHLLVMSCHITQAEDCLRLEEERVENYLHASTKPKLLREVESELLAKYENDLLQKEHSGCAALLRDDKVRLLRSVLFWHHRNAYLGTLWRLRRALLVAGW
jgi:hypothetical protein